MAHVSKPGNISNYFIEILPEHEWNAPRTATAQVRLGYTVDDSLPLVTDMSSTALTKDPRIVNVSAVAHRSPFRYPGGKTWLVPRVRQWLSSIERPAELIEPFAGGAIIGLSSIFDDLVDRVSLVEIDDDVAAVWHTIVRGCGNQLASQILAFDMTAENVERLIKAPAATVFDRAFATIVKNRVSRGGILAPGVGLMNKGENGKGLASRWYPETLSKRIVAIGEMLDRITFSQRDGMDVMYENRDRTDAAFFIDPPYTVAGKRLYKHSILNHSLLFERAASLQGDFLITYDNSEEIAGLAKAQGLETRTVPMKSTHHSCKLELLVGRDLRWVAD